MPPTAEAVKSAPNVQNMNRSVVDSIIKSEQAPAVKPDATTPPPVVQGTPPPPVKEVITDTKPAQQDLPSMDIPAALMDKIRPAKKVQPKAQERTEDHDQFDPEAIKLDDVDPKIRVNLGRLREKWRAAEKRATELESKLKDQKPDAESVETLAAVRQENERLMNELSKIKIEADPRFKAKYDRAINPLLETAKSVLTSYEIKDIEPAEMMAKMRGMNPRMRAEYLASQLPDELAPGAIAAILPLVSQLDVIESTRKAEVDASKETAQALDEEARVGAQQDAIAAMITAKAGALKAVAEQEIFLQKVPGNEKWNAAVDALHDRIDSTFRSRDAGSHARAVVESALVPIYKSMFIEERTRRESLENTLRDRNIILPGVGQGSPTTQDGSGRIGPTMTADQAVAAISARMAAKRI